MQRAPAPATLGSVFDLATAHAPSDKLNRERQSTTTNRTFQSVSKKQRHDSIALRIVINPILPPLLVGWAFPFRSTPKELRNTTKIQSCVNALSLSLALDGSRLIHEDSTKERRGSPKRPDCFVGLGLSDYPNRSPERIGRLLFRLAMLMV